MKKWICVLLAVALLWLAGCGMDTQEAYEKAQSLYQAGKYAQAAEAFEALGDYVDSPLMLKACHYALAEEQYQAGDYAGAAKAFEALGDYQNSGQRITACHYALAEELYGDEAFLEAAAAFAALGDYQDSAWRAMICQYAYARQLFDQGEYLAAAQAAAGLEDDTGAQILYQQARWLALQDFLIHQPPYTNLEGCSVGITAIDPDQLTLWVEKTMDLGFYVAIDRCAISFRLGEAEGQYELQIQTVTEADGLKGRTSCSANGTVLLAELTADTQLPITNFFYYGQDVYGNVTQRTEPWVGERERMDQVRDMLAVLLEQAAVLLEQSGTGYTLRELGLSAME